MKKTIFVSMLTAMTLFANENNVVLSEQEAIQKLSIAVKKLMIKSNSLESEIKSINNQIVSLNDLKKELLRNDKKSFKKINQNESQNFNEKVDVVITSWYANLRKAPSLKSKVGKIAKAGDRFKVIKEHGDFYKLDNGLFVAKVLTQDYKPFKLYVKKYSHIQHLTGKHKKVKKIYRGNLLNAVGEHKNKKWFILEDGGFVNKNVVEIER